MGRPMAARLLDAGFQLTVWNRTAERADPLVALGARRAESPAAAVSDAEIIVLMLADPPAVERVLHGEDGVLRGARRGATVVDCSTIGPEDARAAAASCASAGLSYVDAPVLGSLRQAEAGELVALVGGSETAVRAAEPMLGVLTKRVVHAGETGQGSALKLVMNLLVGGLTELLAESITLAERAGLDPAVVRDTLTTSVLASPVIGYKAPQLFERSFAPLFSTQLMLKDLELVLHLASDLGVALPATRTIRDMYSRSAAAGRAHADFSAVIEELGAEPGAAAAARGE